MVQFKSKDIEDIYIAPNEFDKTFEEIGIQTGATLSLIEVRNNKQFNEMNMEDFGGEEGEFEMEEMEEEQEEDNDEEEN